MAHLNRREYVNENYLAVAKSLNLTKEQIAQLAKNSFTASFLEGEEKQKMIEKVEEYIQFLFR